MKNKACLTTNKIVLFILIFACVFCFAKSASAVLFGDWLIDEYYTPTVQWLLHPNQADGYDRLAWGKDQKIEWDKTAVGTFWANLWWALSSDTYWTHFAALNDTNGYPTYAGEYYIWLGTDHPGRLQNKEFYLLLQFAPSYYVNDMEKVYFDAKPPTNPASVSVYDSSAKANTLSTGNWYSYASPYFEWPASTSSDIDHYHAYLGPSASEPSLSEFIEIGRTTRNYTKTLSSSGIYYYWMSAEDTSTSMDTHPGNVSDAVNFFVYKCDITAPTVQLEPLPQHYNGTSFTVQWSGSDGHSGIENFEVQYKSSAMANFETWLTTTSTAEIFSGAQNNLTYSFRVRAIDNALPSGNVSDWSAEDSIAIDTTAPTSNVTQPNGSVNTITPKIYWTGNDFMSGIQNYYIEYKDTTAGTGWQPFYAGTSTNQLFNAVNNHTYCFRSQATDRAGNIEEWTTNPNGDITFTVIAGDPPVNLQITTNYDNSTPSFQWDAPAETSGGYSISFESEPDESIDLPGHESTNYTSPVSLNDGYHYFYVRSQKQSDGVWSGAVGISFIIDTLPPSIDSVSTNVSGSIINISGTANDGVEIEIVLYKIVDGDGNTILNWVPASGSFGQPSVNFSISEMLSDGTYRVQIKTRDSVGRESGIYETSNFTIDEHGPEIYMTIDNNNFSTSSINPVTVDPKLQIRATITDGNGIDGVSLLISGGNGHYEPVTNGETTYQLIYSLPDELEEGEYDVTIHASSEGKQSDLIVRIQVYAGGVRTLSAPYSYPNPFKPGIDSIKIRYELSRASDTRLVIYNALGKPVRNFKFVESEEGGAAGVNTPQWDGKDNFGKTVPNGVYYYFIIVDGKVIGRGEMAAFK